MLPKFTLSPMLVLIPNTAKIASRIPTRPSPAIIPAQYSVPSVDCCSFVFSSTFLRASITIRTTPPISYEFLINGEVVQQKSELNTFTYTFSESGSYDVSVRSYNAIDDCAEETLYNYTVVDAYESENPVICGIHTDKDYIGKSDKNVTITANAFMGTAPYQYKFTLDNGLLVQDYSDDNNFFIDMHKLNYENNTPLEIGDHTVLVEVKDANGKTAQETFTFEVKEPRM